MNDCIVDDMWNGLCSEKGRRASDNEKWSESVGLMVPEQQAHIAHTVRLYMMDKYKNTTYTRECAVHMYVRMHVHMCEWAYVHKCAMSTYYSFQEFIRRHS